jgi:hypothetical protein
MRIAKYLLITALFACGKNPTATNQQDRLDGQVLFKYQDTQLPSMEYKPIDAEQVRYWTFENGTVSVRTEILTAHSGSRLPDSQSTLFWAQGMYWKEACTGRSCTYVFELTDGQYFDYREMSLVSNGSRIYTVDLIFGETGIQLGDNRYLFTDLSNLPMVRNGALNKRSAG